MTKLLLCIFFCTFSCQTVSSSEETFIPLDSETKILVKDSIEALKARFSPAKTKFIFPHEDKVLGRALEDGLRQEGFAVSNDESSKGPEFIKLRYTLDKIGENNVFLRLVLGDTLQMSRVYQQNKSDGLLPAGPLAVRGS